MKNFRIPLLALSLAVTGALAQGPIEESATPPKAAPPKKAEPAKKAPPPKKPQDAKKAEPAKKAAPPAKKSEPAKPRSGVYKAGDPNTPKLYDKDGKVIPTTPEAYDVSSATKK